ncbi:MAG: hypothetical protein AAB262_05385, partial [Elusimicrobiota bacterium]
ARLNFREHLLEVNAHLRLNANGVRLTGRLANAAFVQRPWQVNEQGRVLMRLIYPPVRPEAVISWQADFFEDYRQEMLAFLKGRPLPDAQNYRTLISETRPGRIKRVFIAFAVGAKGLLGAAETWPALAALALALAPAAPARRRTIGGLLALAAGLTAAVRHPSSAPDAAAWAAGLLAATAAGGWLGAVVNDLLAAAALAALGWVWGAWTFPWLPAATPGAGLCAAAAVGTMTAAAALLAAGWGAARAERNRLKTISEMHAARLFERRRRLAATALLLVCGYGLSQNIPR